MRAPKSGILAGAIILVAALVGALPAAAATTTARATWQPLTGQAGRTRPPCRWRRSPH